MLRRKEVEWDEEAVCDANDGGLECALTAEETLEGDEEMEEVDVSND